jgi:hypothetical protein
MKRRNLQFELVKGPVSEMVEVDLASHVERCKWRSLTDEFENLCRRAVALDFVSKLRRLSHLLGEGEEGADRFDTLHASFAAKKFVSQRAGGMNTQSFDEATEGLVKLLGVEVVEDGYRVGLQQAAGDVLVEFQKLVGLEVFQVLFAEVFLNLGEGLEIIRDVFLKLDISLKETADDPKAKGESFESSGGGQRTRTEKPVLKAQGFFPRR